MATVLDIIEIPYDVARSVGCILHGVHVYTTPVGMHPQGPKDQSILGTNNRIPSIWPFFQGGQTPSHLQLSGTKDLCMATNPLGPRIPTLQSLIGRHSYEITTQTVYFHHPNM